MLGSILIESRSGKNGTEAGFSTSSLEHYYHTLDPKLRASDPALGWSQSKGSIVLINSLKCLIHP
jgi:hypothetical protein